MNIEILDVQGYRTVLQYVGLPVDHQHEDLRDALSTLSRLVKAGDEHAKLTRMIVAWMEIEAPRYWWQEMDTYRVGVEGYSASTMHTITKKPLSAENFENPTYLHEETLSDLNSLVDEKEWYVLKSVLPESFLQKRLKMFSYQALRRIYYQRKNHRLPEWKVFIEALSELPFSKELIFV